MAETDIPQSFDDEQLRQVKRARNFPKDAPFRSARAVEAGRVSDCAVPACFANRASLASL
jgi:phage FluMu gp28-like protein